MLHKLVNRRFAEVTGCNNEMEVIARHTNRTHFGTAVSIGCGSASEELWMMQQSFVDRFILYDISTVQLQLASAQASQRNVSRTTAVDKDIPRELAGAKVTILPISPGGCRTRSSAAPA